MKTGVPWKAITIMAVMAISGLTALSAGADEVQSLRGVQVDEPVVMEPTARPKNERMQRAYRQQPPLVPHKVAPYQIDLKVNQCLNCHDWSNAGDHNAPTLSMTHYTDRDGKQTDAVAGNRWFCTQCHVPQVNAEPLVENEFKSSSER
ncbi:nitrate reductase cytochrome c-type subunit [Polycladidibacter stylochi]|uniref:nitrate reductase cytochrome c-type subunit n=1 Tax=Polycladidibacter stylochi TaxID=1807766 RepID=UPI000AE561C7|nr:nitrate reductase cytochrome c-type subunit [Pseudovibrio stylochi]